MASWSVHGCSSDRLSVSLYLSFHLSSVDFCLSVSVRLLVRPLVCPNGRGTQAHICGWVLEKLSCHWPLCFQQTVKLRCHAATLADLKRIKRGCFDDQSHWSSCCLVAQRFTGINSSSGEQSLTDTWEEEEFVRCFWKELRSSKDLISIIIERWPLSRVSSSCLWRRLPLCRQRKSVRRRGTSENYSEKLIKLAVFQ